MMRVAWVAVFAPSLLFAQDTEDTIRKKHTEVIAFLKAAKTERELRAALGDLAKLGESAFSIDRYDLASAMYGDAEKTARILKDADLALSLRDSAIRAKEIGKEYARIIRSELKISAGQGEPEDYSALGKFLCFTKGYWTPGIATLAKGKEEVLQKLAKADMDGGPTPEDEVELGDSWLAFSKKEPAARERAAYWFSKAFPKTTGVSHEKLRAKLRSALFRPGKPASKPPAYPVSNQTKARILIDETCSASGAKSLVLLPGDQKTTGGDHFPKFRPLVPGKYTLSVKVLTDGTTKDWPIFLVKIKTPDGKETPVGGLSSPVDQPWWVEIENKFEVPQGATVVFYGSAWHDAGTIWLDDLSLKGEGGVEFIENGGWDR